MNYVPPGMQTADALVLRIVEGEPELWPALQAQIQPTIVAIARAHAEMRRRGLGALEDDVAEVTAATLERLGRDDFKNLRRFAARPAGDALVRSFDSWLYGAVDFAVREHLRKRYGRAPRAAGEPARARPSRRDLQSHAGRLDDAQSDGSLLQTLQMTAKITATEVFAFAAEHFAPDEVRALRLHYVDEQTFSELATSLSLASPAEAERMIRRLNARLRYRFLREPEPHEDAS